MEQYLLDSQPFKFDSYIYSQVVSDVAPLEFDLVQLQGKLAQNLASKRFITDTFLGMHKNFSYRQLAEAAPTGENAGPVSEDLPAAYALPLSPDQRTHLMTHIGHMQLEELQEITGILDALGLLAAQQQEGQHQHAMSPADLVKDAVSTHADRGAQSASAPPRRPSGFFARHRLQELKLAHLQPLRDFFRQQYQQQGYQFADMSPLLKAPLTPDLQADLKSRLGAACTQDPSNRQILAELVATLRDAELETLPAQANQGTSLRSVCEAWAYDADEFPVSALGDLSCSQYEAVMKIMLQVSPQCPYVACTACCVVPAKAAAEATCTDSIDTDIVKYRVGLLHLKLYGPVHCMCTGPHARLYWAVTFMDEGLMTSSYLCVSGATQQDFRLSTYLLDKVGHCSKV